MSYTCSPDESTIKSVLFDFLENEFGCSKNPIYYNNVIDTMIDKYGGIQKINSFSLAGINLCYQT